MDFGITLFRAGVALSFASVVAMSAPAPGAAGAVKRIALTVEEAGGVDRIAWPVTQGVPFAAADFPVGARARVLLDDGRAVPTQTLPLATWTPHKKSVKWLLIDFQIDLEANQTRKVFLEYGPDLDPVKPDRPVEVRKLRDGELLQVDTGALQLDLRTDDADFLAACRVRDGDEWKPLLGDGESPCLYITHRDGRRFQSNHSPEPPTIDVEDAGPLRASVCIRGRHATGDGKSRFCPYVLRIHAFAGRSDLRIFHTFVFDGNVERDVLTGVGLHLPVQLGQNVTLTFGGENEPHELGEAESGLFLQTSDSAYVVRRDGEKLAEGGRTRGWAGLSGTGGSVVAVLRDLWKEFPKGMELTRGAMDLQVWPKACGKEIVFHTPFAEKAIWFHGTRSEEKVRKLLAESPTAPLNLKSFNIESEEELVWVESMVNKYAPDRPVTHTDTGTSDGFGAAKTHELVLHFSPRAAAPGEAEAFGRRVQEPVIAPADPAHTCATRAAGHVWHAADPRFKKVNEGLDAVVETVILEPRRLLRRYGMWLYGSLICSHATGPGYSYRYHKNRGDLMSAAKFFSPYNNESQDMMVNVWCHFVRTGTRKHYLLAESCTEQLADVTFYHVGGAAGLMHYHNAHYWSGGPSPSHTLLGGLLLHYYFAGNRRLLDVVRETGEWLARSQEPCGIVSNRGGVLHREFTAPLICAFQVYEATWEERFGRLARRSLTWLLRTQEIPGVFPVTVFTRGEHGDEAWVNPGSRPGNHFAIVYPIYAAGLRHCDSELLRRTILAEADYFVFRGAIHQYYTDPMVRRQLSRLSELYRIDDRWYWCNWPAPDTDSSAPTVAIAYEMTRNLLYAAWAKYILDEWFLDRAERVKNLAPLLFSDVRLGRPMSALMWMVADAEQRDPEGFKTAQAEWRRRRESNGFEIYDGPHGWLPRDQEHFCANGHIIGAKPVKFEDLPQYRDPNKLRQPWSIGRVSPEPEPAEQ